MIIIDWNYHLQEQSSRKAVVSQRSVRDQPPGTADLGNYCQKKPKKTTAESPKMKWPLEGSGWEAIWLSGLYPAFSEIPVEVTFDIEERNRDGGKLGKRDCQLGPASTKL